MTRVFKMLSAIAGGALSTVKRYPVVLAPFFLIALFEIVILATLFYAPRPPLSIALAPIIRTFWGEQFLHYPANFLLLPHLFNHCRNIASFFIGITLTGISVAFIAQAYQGERPEWWPAIKKVVRWYVRLAVVWGIIFFGSIGAVELLGLFTPALHLAKYAFFVEFAVSIGIQMLFVFCIPAIIVENKKIALSIVRSLALVKNYPLVTFLFVLVPGLLFLPVTWLHVKIPLLMERVAPEAVLYVIIARILVVTFIDLVITASATVLLLLHRERESREATV